MTTELEQFQIDLNDMAMQMQRDSAEWGRQIYIRQQIRKLTAQMAQTSADDLRRLADAMTEASGRPQQPVFPDYERDQPTIAPRFAPNGNGHQAMQDVVSRSYRNGGMN